MSDMIVDTQKLRGYAQRITDVNGRLTRLDQRIETLYTRVGLQGLWNLMREDALTASSNRLNQCKSYLEQTAADFETVEREIVGLDLSSFTPKAGASFVPTAEESKIDVSRWIKLLGLTNPIYMPNAIGMGIAQGVISLVSSEGWNTFWTEGFSEKGGFWAIDPDNEDLFYSKYGWEKSAEGTFEFMKYEDKKKLGDKDHWNKNIKQTEKDIYQKNLDEKFYQKKGTIFEAKGEQKLEGSVLHGKASGEAKYAQGSIEAKILAGEVHAEVSGGFYVYEKDKDGNVTRIFSPGVNAEIGASGAVSQVEAEGRVGLGENNDMLGLYGKVDAQALSAEAKGKIAFNRKEAYAGASLEADLVKVSGSGGLAVLGTDIGVSGSLKVGVGAHAKVGYTDGKVKVDIGAAVGVGLDLGFEVDVGGTVDAVCGAVTSIWDEFTGNFSAGGGGGGGGGR